MLQWYALELKNVQTEKSTNGPEWPSELMCAMAWLWLALRYYGGDVIVVDVMVLRPLWT